MSDRIPLHMFARVTGHKLVFPNGLPLEVFNEQVDGCNYFTSVGISRIGETKYTHRKPKRLVPADEGFRWISFYNEDKTNGPLLGSIDRDAREEYIDYIKFDGKSLYLTERDKQFLQLENKALVLGDCIDMRIFNSETFDKYAEHLKKWNTLRLFRQAKPVTHSFQHLFSKK